jgi:hypothetical protein
MVHWQKGWLIANYIASLFKTLRLSVAGLALIFSWTPPPAGIGTDRQER